MVYHIKKTNKENFSIEDPLWEEIESLSINCFPWESYQQPIRTTAKLVYTDVGITVQCTTDEQPLTAVKTHMNDSVCEDSCMEFFLRSRDSARYMNLEFNPLGTMLIGIGTSSGNNALPFDTPPIRTVSKIDTGSWTLQFTLPFSFAETYLGNIRPSFYGNFYKCGDKTEHPHYACWSPITYATPNFHLPDQFGKFILV